MTRGGLHNMYVIMTCNVFHNVIVKCNMFRSVNVFMSVQ